MFDTNIVLMLSVFAPLQHIIILGAQMCDTGPSWYHFLWLWCIKQTGPEMPALYYITDGDNANQPSVGQGLQWLLLDHA